MDPQQDIDQYLQASEQARIRITHIIETHIQADHLSGCRELSAKTGAPIYLHKAAQAHFDFRPLRDGDDLDLGNVRVRVLHTPGHSPESICLLVTDKTRGADPWLLLTGDTLFVGDAGRPDLHGVEESHRLAEELYDSLFVKLRALDDALAVYPAHFAGSACGRGMSGNPSSTLGFERRFNPALQARSRPDFVQFMLKDLPPQPPEFDTIRRKNQGTRDDRAGASDSSNRTREAPLQRKPGP